MSELEDRLATVVREAVADALESVDLGPAPQVTAPESWRSRVWTVDPETRLTLSEAADALGVSERSVRRYVDGSGERPALPAQRGPTGLTIRAGDLREWVEDLEGANRFRQQAAGGGR